MTDSPLVSPQKTTISAAHQKQLDNQKRKKSQSPNRSNQPECEQIVKKPSPAKSEKDEHINGRNGKDSTSGKSKSSISKDLFPANTDKNSKVKSEIITSDASEECSTADSTPLSEPTKVEPASEPEDQIKQESQKQNKKHLKTVSKIKSASKVKRSPRPKIKSKTRITDDGKRDSKITEYFSVRRSGRVPETKLKKDKESDMMKRLLSTDESGLKVVDFEGKGRGIVSDRLFGKGEYVIEYKGDLIDIPTAKAREQQYADDSQVGCYMYYFKCNEKSFCVDATAESPYLGRLINHSAKRPNLVTRSLMVNEEARLLLIAKRDIKTGEELLYNYGDRDKETIARNPWLINS